jgi:hypothetical protein
MSANYKIIIATVLLLVIGCGPTSRRFVPLNGQPDFALDTETGQKCLSIPKVLVAGGDTGNIPFCYDLYKGSK